MIIIILAIMALLTVLSCMVIIEAVGGTVFTVVFIELAACALIVMFIVKFLYKRIQRNES